MGQVGRQLSELSRTLASPGVGDAMLQAAGTDLGLRRFASQKKRQDILDTRATELWESGATGREVAQQKAAEEAAPGGINLYEWLPSNLDPGELAHLFAEPGKPRNKKDGITSIVGGAPRYLTKDPNAKFDLESGALLSGKGEPIILPGWKRTRLKKGFMGYIASRTSPIRAAEGMINKQRDSLKEIDKTTPEGMAEYTTLSEKINQAEKLIKTDEWQVDAYQRYAQQMDEYGRIAGVEGADPEYTRQFKEARTWAEGKVKGIADKATTKHKQKTETYKAKSGRMIAEAAVSRAAGAGKEKPPTRQYAFKRISDIEKQRDSLGETNIITAFAAAMLAANDTGKEEGADFKELIGKKADPGIRAKVNAAFDREIAYLEQFAGEKAEKTAKPEPIAVDQNVTHEYIVGQGLVEIKK